MAAHDIVMAAAGASGPTYVEDVFSTYLYTGPGVSGLTINNGIDLTGKGGLVWLKNRSAAQSHGLFDTARGSDNYLCSNETASQYNFPSNGINFTNSGFSLDAFSYFGGAGAGTGNTYTSWTFRKQPKFFDVVTYTGTGANRTIAHALGSTPGCIIVKRVDAISDWFVYHRGTNGGTNPEQYFTNLDLTSAQTASSVAWNNTAPTSTDFTLGSGSGVNANGGTFVAYIFAHNAGGFGLTGTDNVISCGSLTGSNPTNYVNLGYEPQWLLLKQSNGVGNWYMYDTMRGWTASGSDAVLEADLSNAEATISSFYVDATGFGYNGNLAGLNYIYTVIRKGPMKVPTDATKVFSPQTAAGVQTTNFVVDSHIGVTSRSSPLAGVDPNTRSRLIGVPYLNTSSTNAETGATSVGFDSNTGLTYSWTAGGVNWYFRRAPGFFDEVCYTGTGSAMNVAHNLGVAPELIIWKPRNVAGSGSQWFVFSTPSAGIYGYPYVGTNLTNAAFVGYDVLSSAPTSTQMPLSGGTVTNGYTYVAYLFASCPGVSKVGSYTGTGAAQTINCGFAAGARFVLIKRTDSTGDWYVWDTARGIISGNDPYLLLNSTAAEVTTTDYIAPQSVGFGLTASAPAALNASGGSYIFLAIA